MLQKILFMSPIQKCTYQVSGIFFKKSVFQTCFGRFLGQISGFSGYLRYSIHEAQIPCPKTYLRVRKMKIYFKNSGLFLQNRHFSVFFSDYSRLFFFYNFYSIFLVILVDSVGFFQNAICNI